MSCLGADKTTNSRIDEASEESNVGGPSNTKNVFAAVGCENNSGAKEEGRIRRRPTYLSDYATGDEEKA